jgi:hypothetical protein
LTLGIEIIGVDCVFRELGLVSWILMLIYINKGLCQLPVHGVYLRWRDLPLSGWSAAERARSQAHDKEGDR